VSQPRLLRWGGSTFIVITVLVILAVIVMAAFVIGGGRDATSSVGADLYHADRGSFEISVPASGELAAAKQVEIRNRLESRGIIEFIVPEGTYVKTGDVLFKVAHDELDDRIEDAEDGVREAENGLVNSEANLKLRVSERDSAVDQAELDVELADLALLAWEKGEDKSRRKELDLELETAQKDFERLNDKYTESKELFRQSFLSLDELRTDEIDMIRAQSRLAQAELAKQIYEQYEFVQQQKQKLSDVEQAKAELDRVRTRHATEIGKAEYEVANAKQDLESKTERRDDLLEQLEFCTVKAPQDGLTVYAQSLEQHRWGRGDRGDLQVGAEISKNELVMVLPDVSTMTAKVKVNESLTGVIEPGQRVIVTPDATPDVALEGEVQTIAVLAESGGWRDPNRRDYTVTVLLTGDNDLGLKPSMRCKAEIYVGLVEDTIFVPLQAIFREGPTAFVYVPQDHGFAQRAVQTGESSGLFVEITRGLEQGESVLLREPKAREIVARLADQAPATGQASLDQPAVYGERSPASGEAGRGHGRRGGGRPPGGTG